MKMHKTYKITLALLAALLVVIGTTATVVAEGPETAPVVEQNIDAYLDQTSRVLVNEMNLTFQNFVAEAWTHLKQIAPSEDWEAAIRNIIPQTHANAQSQGGLVGVTGGSNVAQSNNCSFDYYTTLGSSGWAAAVTRSSCTKDFLIAKVLIRYTGGATDSRSCFNCRSVFAYVNGLACGYYLADGRHEWGNPSVTKSSSDDGNAGCE